MKLDNIQVFGSEDLDDVQLQYEDMCHGSHRVKFADDFEMSEEELQCGLIEVESMSDAQFLDWLKVRDEVLSYRK